MKAKRFFLSFLAVLSVVVAVGAAALWFFLPSMCANEVLAEVPSPDRAKKVVVFQRACGATTGFSTQASLLNASQKLKNVQGNIFVSDTDHGAAPSGPGGGPALSVAWQSNESVAFTYHPQVRIFKAAVKVGRIQFSYSKVGQ